MTASNATGFRGVSKNKKRYRARVKRAGITTIVGTFDTPQEAHAAYLAEKQRMEGETSTVTVEPPRKNFSWSWSRFKNYKTCPKRHYHVDIARDFKEAKSEYLTWGHEVHEALADRIGHGARLPSTMQQYEDWPQRILAAGAAGLTLKVENQLAMDEQFQPCAYYAPTTWFRGVVDVLGIMPEETAAAFSIDWKTGKVEPEFEQLALSAQLIFAHYPKVDAILAIYVWLGHDTQTVKIYERDKMQQTWNDVMPQVREMEFAHRTLTYPPKPGGLCKKYCPVTSCPYYGKGSR